MIYRKFAMAIAALCMSCVVYAADMQVSTTETELLVVNTNVCKLVGDNTAGLVEAIEEGRHEDEIVNIFAIAINDSLKDDDTYLALWMVSTARDHIRGLLTDASVLKFLHENKQFTRKQAVGYVMKVACAKNEGTAQDVPKRVLVKKDTGYTM